MRCKLLEKVQRIASRACCKAAWERKEHSTRHHAGACRKLFEKVKKLKTITVIPSKTQETGGRLAGGRMAGCGRVAVWPCGHVAMWPCGRGRVAAWPGGRVAVVVAGWPGGRVAGWPGGRVAVAVAVAGLWPWPGWPATKKSYCGIMWGFNPVRSVQPFSKRGKASNTSTTHRGASNKNRGMRPSYSFDTTEH